MNTAALDAEQLLAEDRRSRARALELASFIVEAPAGAGKTELLTQRYLRLLAVVNEPEEIVAITFTNKAAAEMRNRILASLERAVSGVAPEEPHKRLTFELAQAALHAGAQRGWVLLDQPARLRILTIDALCASLARQMPFLSRFGAQPRISDDAERHYAEAAQRTLALLDVDAPFADTVAAALRHFDNDVGRLSGLLASMLARRDQWLRHALGTQLRVEAEQALAALIGRDLERAAEFLDRRLQAALMPLARFAAANLPEAPAFAPLLDWQTPLSGMPEELPHWRALRQLLLTGSGTVRKKLTKNEGFPPKIADEQKQALMALLADLDAQSGAEAALARLGELPDAHYSDADWQTVEIMAQLLKLAAGQLWTVFNEQGEADFVEVAQRALLALGDAESPSELALKLDYRIQHLLVDEFQDTSPTQVQLLQRLTTGWQEGDGRTLFCVGDPMQSIYRFRKADVGLFLRAAETGIGHIALQPLRLCRNNRSCAAIVDWINRSFATVFPAQDSVSDGAIRYREFVAVRADQPAAGVQVHALLAEAAAAVTDADDAPDVREAERILQIVAAERAAAAALGVPRTIAVLVRARSHLDALVALVRSRQPQLRFQAVEIERLAQRQVVQDLLSLTHALHQRADRVHWLAVLRAPWCGLRLADLHALAADNQVATIWQLLQDGARLQRLSPDGQLRLRHVQAVFAEAFAQQGRMPLRRWVEAVWFKLGGAACLRAAQEAADVADVQSFFALLDTLDAAGRFSLAELEQEVAELYAAPDALADGSLQFMTIHKSKGLEFDTVILPGLQRKGRGDERTLMLWEEVAIEGLAEQLVAAPLTQGGANGVPTPYDFLRQLEQQRSANELTRVLYVAATRAIRCLHLVGMVRTNQAGEPLRPGGSFLDLLWPAMRDEYAGVASIGQEPCAGAVSPPEFEAPLTPLVRVAVVAGNALPGLESVNVERISTVSAPGPQESGAGLPAAADRFAADVGTLLHVYLERIAIDTLNGWDAARIKALLPAMQRWLTRHGYAAELAQQGAQRVAAALHTTLASAEGRWVLGAQQDRAAELMLASAEAEAAGAASIATHVVDRSFVADGQRWIIDYKSAQFDGDAPPQTLLVTHANGYRAQLERYAALFAGEGLPQRLAIFYATLGRLVELPAQAALWNG